jgi:hypothetical protein
LFSDASHISCPIHIPYPDEETIGRFIERACEQEEICIHLCDKKVHLVITDKD